MQSNLSDEEDREGWESSFPHCICIQSWDREKKGVKLDKVPSCLHAARKVASWTSLRECLGLIKGHRGAGLGHSRCFLRSQEQPGSQGCRRYLLFFSWEMGFT